MNPILSKTVLQTTITCSLCGKNGHTETCHYNKTSHTIETGYKKHNYPPGYRFQYGKSSQINNMVVQETIFSIKIRSNRTVETFASHNNNIKFFQIFSNLLIIQMVVLKLIKLVQFLLIIRIRIPHLEVISKT